MEQCMAEHTTPVSGTSSELGAFVSRHVGSDPRDTRTMLDMVGCDQLADLMDKPAIFNPPANSVRVTVLNTKFGPKPICIRTEF